MSSRAFVPLLAFAMACCWAAFVEAAPPVPELTADQIAALAPVIRGGDGRVKTLFVRASLTPEIPAYSIQLLLEKPDRAAMLVRDGVDRGPLLLAVDGHVLVYDLPAGGIDLFDGYPAFQLFQNQGRLTFNFTLFRGDHPAFDETIIDLASIVSQATKDRQARGSRKTGYILTAQTERGSRIEAQVDPALQCPYTRLDILPKGQPHPVVRLEQLDVNKPPPIRGFRFPTDAELSGLSIQKPDAGTDQAAVLKQRSIVEATLACRRSIRRPELREAFARQFAGGKPIDWEAMKRKDEEISTKLRKIVADAKLATTEPVAKPEEPNSGQSTPGK